MALKWYNPATWNQPRIISKKLTVEDVSRIQPNRANVAEKLIISQLIRADEDLKKWRFAIQAAESEVNPDRTELIRVYRDIELDAHMSSLVQSRKIGVLSSEWSIVDKDGNKDDELTELFSKEWFDMVQGFIIDSRFYGYELIQFFDFIDDEWARVMKIREDMVIPDRRISLTGVATDSNQDLQTVGVVKFKRGDRSRFIPFNEKPFIDWLVRAGDPKDLGLYMKAAPLVIWKKNVESAWSERAEVFGIPIRIGKTNVRNKELKKNMNDGLKNMGRASFAVLDLKDEIQIVESNAPDGHKIYKEFIEHINKELSKMVLGQTMTTDDGSSRSQGEVHERQLNSWQQADRRFVKYIVEKEVFRIMRRHSLMTQQPRFFKWDSDEKLTKLQQLAVVTGLKQAGFKVNKDQVQDTFGFQIDDPEPTPFDLFGNPTEEDEEQMENLSNVEKLYAGFVKPKKK